MLCYINAVASSLQVHGDPSRDGSGRSLDIPEGQCSIGLQPVFCSHVERCSQVEPLANSFSPGAKKVRRGPLTYLVKHDTMPKTAKGVSARALTTDTDNRQLPDTDTAFTRCACESPCRLSPALSRGRTVYNWTRRLSRVHTACWYGATSPRRPRGIDRSFPGCANLRP
jgi:hypothetical protein